MFSDFSTLRPIFQKVRFQALRFQDPYGRSAKTTQYVCVFAKERCLLDEAYEALHTKTVFCVFMQKCTCIASI